MNVNQIVDAWGGYGNLDDYRRKVDHTFSDMTITFNPMTVLFRLQYVCPHGNSKLILNYKPLVGIEDSLLQCDTMASGTLNRHRCPEWGTFVPLERFYYENISQGKLTPAQAVKYMGITKYLKTCASQANRKQIQ